MKKIMLLMMILVCCMSIFGCGKRGDRASVYEETSYVESAMVEIEPTEEPTPMPTEIVEVPIVEPKEEIDLSVFEGETWVVGSYTDTRYGKPKSVTIDTLTSDSATITYVVDESAIRKNECIGLQYDGSEYFVVLECSVQIDGQKVKLVSQKQDREFNSLSNSKNELCVILLDAANKEMMDCCFYSWDWELRLVEKQAEVSKEYNGQIYDDVKTIAVFQEMSAAVTNSNELYLWGYRALNYVADNPIKGTAIEPTYVLSDAKAIYATPGMSGYVLKLDDSLWGFGDYAKNGEYLTRVADGVRMVTANWGSRAIVYNDGRVEVPSAPSRCDEKALENITNVKEMSIGGSHVLTLQNDGTLWGLGENDDRQLGVETEYRAQWYSYVPIMNDVVAIEADLNASYAIKTDGTLWAWGENHKGSLGTWDFANRSEPTKILDGVASINAFEGTVFAITKDATLYVWGQQTSFSESSNYPVKFAEGVVAAKYAHGVLMVIKEDGNLYTCGSNSNKQLGYLTDESFSEYLRLSLKDISLIEK